MENKATINIDGMDVPIGNEKNILEIIRKAGIVLPTFCYHSHLSTYGACRLCVCDIEGMGVQATCTITPRAGMKVKTNTEEIRKIRRVNLELLLANHDINCPSCARSNNCKLQDLARVVGVDKIRFKKIDKTEPVDNRSYSVIHDPNKCVLCGDCVRVCKEVQSVGAIDFINRGSKTKVSPAYMKSLADVECVYCGQCVSVCPVGALVPKQETKEVWRELQDPDKYVVAQIAPAVRAAIGEIFNMGTGVADMSGKMVTVLKKMGFKQVYDTSFSADLTIFEEATEFIERKVKGEKLPQFTSCCPSWVKFAEQYYPELLSNLSTCKSPQQMFGSVAREILPELLGIKPEQLVIVSIMPCTGKKFEAKREEFYHNGIPDVDHVLSTEGLGRMIQEAGIQFQNLAPQSFDLPLGFKTGAGVIFGNAGGVSEAVLRFTYEKLTKEKLADIDFHVTRGLDGIRTAELQLGSVNLKLAIAHGLANARKLCEEAVSGKSEYDIIEVMSCPGGCIAGGGQPVNYEPDFREKRAKVLYDTDKSLQLHKSQENHYVKELYDKHLGEIGGEKAHHLLHTHYHGRKRIVDQHINIRNTNHPKIEAAVCVGTNCFQKGSQELLKQLLNFVVTNRLEDVVGFEGQEEIVDLKAGFCFERCDRGPIAKVNDLIIEYATFEKVKEAIEGELKKIGRLTTIEYGRR